MSNTEEKDKEEEYQRPDFSKYTQYILNDKGEWVGVEDDEPIAFAITTNAPLWALRQQQPSNDKKTEQTPQNSQTIPDVTKETDNIKEPKDTK